MTDNKIPTVNPLYMGTGRNDRSTDFCWKRASLARASPTSESENCFIGHNV
jgi:hypothetical protein